MHIASDLHSLLFFFSFLFFSFLFFFVCVNHMSGDHGSRQHIAASIFLSNEAGELHIISV
jgi:hypothetical protein